MADAKSKKVGAVKRDLTADPNNAKRLKAGTRSSNVHAGKGPEMDALAIEETTPTTPPAEETPNTPPAADEIPAPTPTDETANSATEGEGKEGGIVAAAKEEKAVVEADKGEGEGEPAPEGEGEPKTAIEQFAKEESQEPQHQQKVAPVGEYQPPEGEAHEDLIDQYHEALAMGDLATAKDLYHQLREHRYQENKHRGKAEAEIEQEESDFEAASQELGAKYPELLEDGLAANKVLALQDVYRQEGMNAAEALRKAVADLYHEAGTEGFAEGGEVANPMLDNIKASEASRNAAAEEVAGKTGYKPGTAVETRNTVEKEAKGFEEGGEVDENNATAPDAQDSAPKPKKSKEVELPDMTDRNLRKRNIADVPSANARNEATPEKKEPTRMDAITQMKKARGQG
jgi:hypothetical protein